MTQISALLPYSYGPLFAPVLWKHFKRNETNVEITFRKM